MNTIEKSYLFVFKNIKRAVNPVKKRIMHTECKVHIFINNQAVTILRNDGYIDAYKLMHEYIDDLNAGVVWADQDLKSSNHFFSPTFNKGLYGNSNALIECKAYYKQALMNYLRGNIETSMFYLGAACHLIQDLTVPQHANVRLLDNHRRYENWVVRMHKHHDEFSVNHGGIYLRSIILYVCLNSRKAIKTYKKYSDIKDRETRFHKITSVVLVMAQKTTAGMMYKFYRDIQRLRPKTAERAKRVKLRLQPHINTTKRSK